MAAYEVLLLNTAVPQIQAAQSGDTYVVPRDIAFSAALTLSAGTANGVPYLNASKVLTTGSALTFDGTNLGVGGTSGYETANRTTIAAAGVNSALLGFKVGGTSAGYAFADAFHVEFGAPTGRYLSWDINGERMRIDSSGNLGIGTSSPVTGLTLIKYGTQWTNHTVNTYPQPAGNTFLQMEAVAGQTNWFGFTGSYGATSGSANLLLQVNLNNTSQQAGNYIASEAQSAIAADLTFGKMIGGATTGSNSTKSEQMRLDASGNLGLGGSAQRATTVGTKTLNIFDGTAPVGTLANGVSFYSTAGEARVMDAAGNATLLSPHDTETNEWIFHSKHTPSGKVLRIDVERLLRFVNAHFGLDAVKEFVEE